MCQKLDMAESCARLRMCESGEQWGWAIRRLDMCREGLGLGAETCNVGLAAGAKAQQWQRALAALERMQLRAVPPDEASYHAATPARSRSGGWEAALVALRGARRAGLADSGAYCIGVKACASAEVWAAAVAMLAATGEDADADDHAPAVPGLAGRARLRHRRLRLRARGCLALVPLTARGDTAGRRAAGRPDLLSVRAAEEQTL